MQAGAIKFLEEVIERKDQEIEDLIDSLDIMCDNWNTGWGGPADEEQLIQYRKAQDLITKIRGNQ